MNSRHDGKPHNRIRTSNGRLWRGSLDGQKEAWTDKELFDIQSFQSPFRADLEYESKHVDFETAVVWHANLRVLRGRCKQLRPYTSPLLLASQAPDKASSNDGAGMHCVQCGVFK